MCHVQTAMMNWGKQSAFDMFSNLMTFQALASQQGQAQDTPIDHPAVALGSQQVHPNSDPPQHIF